MQKSTEKASKKSHMEGTTMDNRYLQKIVLLYEDDTQKEYYVDLEYERVEGSGVSVDIKKVKIHKVYVLNDQINHIMKIDDEKAKENGILPNMYELVRGSFEEIEVDDSLDLLLTEAFLSGVVHTKMYEALDCFTVLHKNELREWSLPSSSAF